MPVPIVLAVVAAAAGVAGIAYLLSDEGQARRGLSRARVVPIASAQDGQVVRVTGRIAVAETLLKAPISGRDCVYYVATAKRLDRDGNLNPWGEIREERYVDFWLEDATGVARVCMRVPRVAVVRDVHTRSGTFDDANEREEAFLRRHGERSTDLIGLNRSLRYVEGTLEPGEEVTVLGRARHETFDGQRRLVLDATPDGPLLVSDDPKVVHA